MVGRLLLETDEGDARASEECSRLGRVDHVNVHFVGTVPCRDDEQLVARLLQILVDVLVVQVEQGEVDGLEDTHRLCLAYSAG